MEKEGLESRTSDFKFNNFKVKHVVFFNNCIFLYIKMLIYLCKIFKNKFNM